MFICLCPITSKGQNGQKKYQINLKSHSGPIHVLLINKESSSSKPVVFPVPPPDDLAQPPSQPPTPVPPHKPSSAVQSLPEPPVSERSQPLQHTPATDLSSGEFTAIVFKSREENMKTALDKLESIFDSLSCDVILLSSIGDKIVNLIFTPLHSQPCYCECTEVPPWLGALYHHLQL